MLKQASLLCALVSRVAALAGPLDAPAPLLDYFDSVKEGPGIWKWRHYFPIYERHFARFKGTDVHVVEIGIYSGGSLKMWRNYFGPRAKVIGIDIANATKIYEGNPEYGSPEKIVLGDQSSPQFWERFKKEVRRVDILIDDGGHMRTMQKPTIDAMWSHLAPGGVYLCEDIVGAHNFFARDIFMHFVTGSAGINAVSAACNHYETEGAVRGDCGANKAYHASGEVQPYLAEASFYPYVIVLTKRVNPLAYTEAPRHGTRWQPPYEEFIRKYSIGDIDALAPLG